MNIQIKLKHLSHLIYTLILVINYGCLPLLIQEPLSDPKANNTASADLALITKTLEHYNALKTLSPQELSEEYAETIESALHEEANKEKLILLSLLAPLSSDQFANSSKSLAEIAPVSTFIHASHKNLLTLLADLAKMRILLLSKIEQTSQTNTTLHENISQHQNNLFIHQHNLSQCEARTNDLQEQIQKLSEIEKIIIKRKEVDVPLQPENTP